MTPAARSTALILSVLVAAFAVAATVVFHLTGWVLRCREDRRGRPRHLKVVRHRHRLAPRHEWLMWTVNTAGRATRATVEFFREDGPQKGAATFVALLVVFSVLIGVNQ